MKPIKCSVAVYLMNPNNKDEFLVVKRPPDDDKLPNVWGLPAVTVKGEELPEQAVIRVGSEKLCTEIKPLGFFGIKYADRGNYVLILMDIKAELIGSEPKVTNSTSQSTKYVDQKWVSDYSVLKEAASKGSLCSQIVLDSKNILY
jgi:ADP-ribose pyrophosphatase YjhB (NUDIX family)